MSDLGQPKFSDAVPHQKEEGGKPVPTHETVAEQVRESKESNEARNAGASNRERMVDIGRGNQQSGRQGQ